MNNLEKVIYFCQVNNKDTRYIAGLKSQLLELIEKYPFFEGYDRIHTKSTMFKLMFALKILKEKV